MTPITPQQFLSRQPAYPDTKPSDEFYLNLANRLLKAQDEKSLFPTVHDGVMQYVALCVIGYYQDIISDAGLWRGFINECRRLYGQPVPFHIANEEYVDYELNKIDIEFLIWYAISMYDTDRRDIYPLHNDILSLADIWFEMLDNAYDLAPVPDEYNLAFQLDIHNPEDATHILRFSQWLFLNSYLVTPAFAMTMFALMQQADMDKEGADIRLHEILEQAMTEQPTGPLALYLREWLFLILHDKMPPPINPSGQENKSAETHKYYTAVTNATGGKETVYIQDYNDLNKFLITVLGWEDGEQHLPQFKNHSDFVIKVDKEKGMLLARNVARCIADPDNHLYNKSYAKKHAFELLTVRGLCPPDLLKMILSNDWLPDAVFPNTDDTETVKKYADFIARCYLQLYYRGD